MNGATAEAVWSILQEECGAGDDRWGFVHHQTNDEPPVEWRFIGALGFGGKFWRTAGRRPDETWGERPGPSLPRRMPRKGRGMLNRAPIITLPPDMADREVHWFFGEKIRGHFAICDEYVTGDVVLGDSGDNKALVTCPECLEWIHA